MLAIAALVFGADVVGADRTLGGDVCDGAGEVALAVGDESAGFKGGEEAPGLPVGGEPDFAGGVGGRVGGGVFDFGRALGGGSGFDRGGVADDRGRGRVPQDRHRAGAGALSVDFVALVFAGDLERPE